MCIRDRKYREENQHDLREKGRKHYEDNKEEINEKKKRKKAESTPEDRRNNFNIDIKDGPNFTCICCHRMLFKTGGMNLDRNGIEKLFNKCPEDILKKATLSALTERSSSATFCHSCLATIRKKHIQSWSISNGLSCDPIPEELYDLTDLEQQFIARSLLFMKVVKYVQSNEIFFLKVRLLNKFLTFSRLPTSRMKANKDRIINVPMGEDDISNTISSLPRTENTSGVVAVKWKRKMAMKNHHLEEFIKPEKLINAVKKLKELGNPFYQDIETVSYTHLTLPTIYSV